MNEPIIDFGYFRSSAPTSVRNVYFEDVSLEADQLLNWLQDGCPTDQDSRFIFWYLEADKFFEDLQKFRTELRQRKTLFLTVVWFSRSFLLILTWRTTDAWKTSFVPWSVVREIREPLQEILEGDEILKILVSETAAKLLRAEVSEMKASILLRKLMGINTYDYQQCNVSVEAPQPDEVTLSRVSECYIRKVKTSGISETIKRFVVPMTSLDINRQDSYVLFAWSGIPVIVFAHAVLTIHAYLLGPSVTSDDAEYPLYATAEYINNTGLLRTAWKPMTDMWEGDPNMINKLSENLRLYTSQGILLHKMTIKEPSWEFEDKLTANHRIGIMDMELQALDRRTARNLLRRVNGKSTPSSATPS